MRDFIARRWFLLALAALLVGGLSFPHPLEGLADRVPQRLVVAIALFMMSLPFDTAAIWRAVRRPTAVLLAVGINFGLTPLLACVVSHGLRADLAAGLVIAGAVPSTIASAAVWTRRAGGNDAIALLVTLVTNLTCFLVTPLWLLLCTGTRVELAVGEMMSSLALQVVLPIGAAQLIRRIAAVAEFAASQKVPLGVLAQMGILTIASVGAVRAGLALDGDQVDIVALDWLLMLLAVVGIHTLMLWAGHALGRMLGIPRADRIAVGFGGSQKTLMIGLYIAVEYFSGLAMLPMIVYHVGQLLIDTLVADRLRSAPPAEEGALAA